MYSPPLAAVLAAFALVATPAFAQDAPFAEPGLFAFAPHGTATADGVDTYVLHLIARDPSGQPMTGLKLKLTSSRGKVRGVTEVSPGLYEITWAPDALDAPTTVTVTASAKTPAKKPVQASLQLVATPGGADAVHLVAEPASSVIGEVAQVALRARGATVLARASRGSIGRWDLGKASYTPDTVPYPHLALITVASPDDPLQHNDFQVILRASRVDFPVAAPATAQVSITLDGKTFGPVTADASGQANVPLEIQPGKHEAKKVVVINGTTTSEPLDLKIPPSRRVQLMPLPASLPTGQALPVRWVVVNADGTPDERATATPTTSAGTLSAPKHLGGGVYEATLTLPRGTEATTVAVALPGEQGQADQLDVSAFDKAVDRVALRTVPEVLDTSTTEAALYIYVQGPGAAGVQADAIDVRAVHATLLSPPGLSAEGVFGARVALDAEAAPSFAASIAPPSLGEHAATLVLDPLADRVAPDGTTVIAVRVGAMDAWGRPVSGVPINLRVDSGDGAITPATTTGDDGSAIVGYRAGTLAGLVSLSATSGSLSTGSALLQAPAGVDGLALPYGGTSASRAAESTWELLHPILRFGDDSASLWDAPAPGDAPVAGAAPDAAVDEPNNETVTTDVVEPAESKPPRAPSAMEPTLRVHGGVALDSYHFSQTPSATPGELLPQSYEVQGALPVGFELGLRGMVSDNIGLDASFGLTHYTATVAAFANQAVPDSLIAARLDALGRYPIPVGAGAAFVGGRLGLHYRDMLLLTGSVDAGQVDLWSVMHPALALGVDAGLDLPSMYVELGGALELDHATAPYGGSYHLLAGYVISDAASLELGVEGMSRSTQEQDGDVVLGTLSDGSLGVRIGAAFAF